MPAILGTAGHIDHGKTALVRALTGQDTDRLAEEKARGISIDLGFAYFEQADGARAGVVDVPGHERFVRNMLAGAHGVDVVLFTVAADDGVMPQTEEHLDILHLLGVRRGIFVVTKTDLVDLARVAAVREEIEILAADTTLDGAPIVPVSVVTGEGLDALRAEIARQLAAPAAPPPPGPFRLPIDRAFVVHGHGVVVTGTAIAGGVRDGDWVRVQPGGERVRVRGIEVHGRAVREAGHGQRVALNLAGVERTAIARGHVVADETLVRTTTRFDAFVEVRPGARRALATHGRVRVHAGTTEAIAKVVLLDGRAELRPRERGWAQIVLAEPVVALRHDRFILRDETARWTLGGGVVAHPFAERHARNEPGLAARLVALRDGDVATAARALLELSPAFACEVAALAEALAVPPAAVRRGLERATDVVAIPDAAAPSAYGTASRWAALADAVVGAVRAAHAERPTEPGADMEHLRSQVAPHVDTKTFRWGVDRLVAERRLVRDENLVRLPSHRVGLDAGARALAADVERRLVAGGFTPPDLRQLAGETGRDPKRLADILGVLEREGRVVRVAPDLWYARAPADDARRLVTEHCRAHGEIAAGTLRDLLGASRKFAIAFLDWCDRTGVTTRVGDARRLRR